jgi:hypothetical protein
MAVALESQLGEYLTPSEAGRELGVTGQRMGQLADEGRIRCVKTKLGRLFLPGDVARLAAERAPFSQRPH